MPNITISLTDTQFAALEYAALSPQDWAVNAVTERARNAIDEIVQITVNKCLETGVQIPGSKDDMVTLAYAQGWIETAHDRQAIARARDAEIQAQGV